MYLEHRLRWWSERWGTLNTQSSGLARAKTRVDRVIISISWRLTSHCHCLQRFINGKLGGLCFLIPCWNFEYAHLTPKHQESTMSKSGVCVCVRVCWCNPFKQKDTKSGNISKAKIHGRLCLLWPQIFAIRSQVGTVHGRGLHIIRWLQDVHLRQASKWSNDSPNLQDPAAFDPPGIPIKFNQLVTSFTTPRPCHRATFLAMAIAVRR